MALETDVLVCGGGCAGLSAALAAARNGAKTLLVERAGFAGGIITTVGLPFFDGIARKQDNKVIVRGIPLELLWKSGVCGPDVEFLPKHNPTIDNVERFKVLADELILAEPNLEVLFHTFACEAEAASGHIEKVLVANKDGLVEIRAKTVIDCTGDADVAARAGATVEKEEPLLPMTMHFRIGNVKRYPDLGKECREALVEAEAEGLLPMFYGPGVGFPFAEDEAYIHAVRVPGDASDARDLTRCEIQGRRDAHTMFDLWKEKVPGFAESYLIYSGPFIGIRETRRIGGVYRLTEEDIRQNRQFEDAIATGCWYMDIHPHKTTVGSANEGEGFQPSSYDIPYGSIQSKDIDNLLVAGRCHSADRMAASSTRVSVTCMAMGQAAGTAAAVGLEAGISVGELSGVKVRQRLDSQHAGPYATE
jgi:hypothetical protein